MKMIERSFEQRDNGFEHQVKFEFEGRTFLAFVRETQDETFIRDCYQFVDSLFPIDIPKYFGEYKSDVYTFIYDNIQRGYPIDQEEQQEGETGE